MKSKTDSTQVNQLCTLIEPPEGIKPIEYKWIFKKKTDMEDNVITYRAKLIAKGYRQRQGIDYDKSKTILLVIAACYDYEI